MVPDEPGVRNLLPVVPLAVESEVQDETARRSNEAALVLDAELPFGED
jgi:hypothetical protein